MKFTLKENPNIFVNANIAVKACVKIIRKIVKKMKTMNQQFIGVQEDIIIIDENNNEFNYYFKIIPNTNTKTNIYYSYDYSIELFKKLAIC